MSIFQKQNRMLLLALVFVLLKGAVLAPAQSSAQEGDADQINALLVSLSHHSKNPSDTLDPTVTGAEREKNLRHFTSSSYKLNIVPNGGPSISGDTATVPVRVHYKAGDGNTLDSSSTAYFVRRSGTWYFANYHFMKWPALLIVVLVLGLLVGISYAVTVLILWSRHAKQGPIGSNAFKVFIPLFWPYLFRQIR